MSGRSTTTNLLLYHDYINTALEQRTQVDTIYTDFSKAFDTVNHSILINKLSSYGVGGPLLSWLSSFITNRYQLIRFNNFVSRYIEVPSGVPQGSHLGPLLFNIFINDISIVLKYSKLLLYADDLKIFRRIGTAADAHCLQQDLDSLHSWSITNKLNFNISKCHVVHFSRSPSVLTFTYSLNGVALATVNEVRDLGVTFHSDLSCGRHIQLVAASAFRKLGCINRCAKHFKHADTLKLLYCTLVRSQLEYASVVWDPYQQNHNLLLERIQHRFLRNICFKLGKPMKFTDHNYDQLYADMNLMTLANRRILLGLSWLHRLLSGAIDCPELLERIRLHVPVRSLRFNTLFHVEHRTSYGANKPLNRLCSLANDFSDRVDFFYTSLSSLRTIISRHLA